MKCITFTCRDCGIDVYQINEYAFMLKDQIWKASVRRVTQVLGAGAASIENLVCIGCLEHRIGRKLYKHDFNWYVPLTCVKSYQRSKRLLDRMSTEHPALIRS